MTLQCEIIFKVHEHIDKSKEQLMSPAVSYFVLNYYFSLRSLKFTELHLELSAKWMDQKMLNMLRCKRALHNRPSEVEETLYTAMVN